MGHLKQRMRNFVIFINSKAENYLFTFKERYYDKKISRKSIKRADNP
jgi:hypothetical protein